MNPFVHFRSLNGKVLREKLKEKKIIVWLKHRKCNIIFARNVLVSRPIGRNDNLQRVYGYMFV